MNLIISKKQLAESVNQISSPSFSTLIETALEKFFVEINTCKKINGFAVDIETESIYVEEFGQKNLFNASQKELVWCYIVKKLKTYGFDKTDIQQLRKNLSICNNIQKCDLILLDYAISYTLTTKHKTCLYINKEGCVKFVDLFIDNTVFDTEDELSIQILLYKYLARIDKNFKTLSYTYFPINKNETELVQLIRCNSNITDIKLKVNSGKLTSADVYEKKALDKKYIDLLNEKAFQTLTVKKENNKISFIQSNYRYFFN